MLTLLFRKSASGLLVLDHFTGSSGLDAHTPDINVPGNPWVENSGTWVVTGGQLKETDGTYKVATIDTEVSNVAISATLVVPGVSDPALIVRFANASNYMVLALNSITSNIELWKRVADQWTQLDFAAYTFLGGEVIRLVADGTSLSGFIDDVEYVFVTEGDLLTNTKHGFFSNAAGFSLVRWDDLTIVEA